MPRDAHTWHATFVRQNDADGVLSMNPRETVRTGGTTMAREWSGGRSQTGVPSHDRIASADRLATRAPTVGSSSPAVHAGSFRRAALLLASLASLATETGCVGAAPGATRDDEPTETIQSKLSLGISVWSWGTTDGTPLDVGPWSTQTCFLAGIAGDMSSGVLAWQFDQFGNAILANAYAGVHKWNDRYQMRAWGGADANFVPTYNAVNARVVCLGTGTKTEISGAWFWGDPPRQLMPVAPNRQCFLQGIYGLEGTWTHWHDYIEIGNDGQMWWIQGSMQPAASGAFGYVDAVCVDLPGGTQVTDIDASAPDPGSALGVPVAWGDWMACGLTGISGALDTSSWTDGAMLNWPSGLTGWWTVDAYNGKTAYGACLQ
jgi:hypothetical protein